MERDDVVGRSERVRHLLSTYLGVSLAVCLLLAAVGGVVAYQEHTRPDTTTEQRVAGEWRSQATFHHQASVQRDTIPFERDEVLENRSLYFTRATPVLNGTYVYRHEGDVESAEVDVALRVVLRSVDRMGEEPTEYWRVSEPLAAANRTVAPGESMRVDFGMNVSRMYNRTELIAMELGANPGTTELLVVAETRASTTLGAESAVDDRTDRLVLEADSTTYAVSANSSGTYTQEATETVTVPLDPDPVRLWGGLAAALLGLVGAAALAVLDHRGALTVAPAVREAIERRAEREEFEEWISLARVPPAEESRVVEVASLPDLVDVAIDSDRRVLEDPAAGRFVVLDDDVRYVYDPDAPDRLGTGGDDIHDADGVLIETGTDEDVLQGPDGADSPNDEDETNGEEDGEPDSDADDRALWRWGE